MSPSVLQKAACFVIGINRSGSASSDDAVPSKTGEPNHVIAMPTSAHYAVLRNREKKMKQTKRITLSMIDAVGGAVERLIGVAFLLLLTGHRVQLVALTQQGHSVEVVTPEVLLGYTIPNRPGEFSKWIKGIWWGDQVLGSGFALTLINPYVSRRYFEVANWLIVN